MAISEAPLSHGPSVAYITCCDNGLYGLKRLIERGLDVRYIVTIPPELGEKYNVSGYADVRPFAESAGIEVVSLDNYTIDLDDIGDRAAELILVNGWNRLIKDEVIERFPLGGLGIHAGHPPIGLGRAPLVWNLLRGRQDLEAYVFRLTPRADDGPIMARLPVEITPWDDVGALYQKVMWAAVDLFETALLAVKNGDPGQSQNLEDAVHYEKRTPEDGLIDFRLSETALHDFIRAQSAPYPGAFTFLNGEKWRIDKGRPFDRFAYRGTVRRPGEILAALPGGLVVMTGGSPYWITQATGENGPLIPADLESLEALVGQRFTAEGAE